MNINVARKIAGFVCATLFAASAVFAQEHKWAGRQLNDLEWTIHERLAVLPYHGVF